MTPSPAILEAQLAALRTLLLTHYRGNRDGMLLVVGWPPTGEAIAFALGIEDEAQLEQVAVMARVLFSRAGVTRYAIAMPVWAGAQEAVVIQAFADTAGLQQTCRLQRQAGRLQAVEPEPAVADFTPWLGDLTAPVRPLPGQMLRRVQAAYDESRLPV